MHEIRLTTAETTSAAVIQQAIDTLAETGGRVVLPALDVTLDRGLELRSNVELAGQGRTTILRKARGRVYPLSGFHNYGMLDAPLMFTDGLEPGMTVAIRDDQHGGFFETFARITWVDGTWVGLDTGLHSDYSAEHQPVLVTSFPLIYGLDVENVAIRDLTLDGNRAEQPAGIGACRGAAVYFLGSHAIEVSNVDESGFLGEGLGFQMSSRVTIRDCRFNNNAGNGFHPGAGSTAALFERCTAEGNGAAGFFFCVRANHITVRECTFTDNVACGISVGTRDSFNRIERCRIDGNAGSGILFRSTDRPVEVEAVHVTGCTIGGNASATGHGQIDVRGDAHDLIFEHNQITGIAGFERAGIYVAPTAERVWLKDNAIHDCFPAVVGDAACMAQERPGFACGIEAAQPQHFRHLR